MSKVCEVCGKHPAAGRNVSHSHRVTNRVFRPNIQKVTIKDAKGHVRKAKRLHELPEGRQGHPRLVFVHIRVTSRGPDGPLLRHDHHLQRSHA